MATLSGGERYEPLSRWGHLSVTIEDKVYVWGGRIEDFSEDSKKKLASSVEVFDIQSEYWVQKSTSGTPPKGLYNCAYATIGNKIFVYGGWDGLTNHGSLHSLDVGTMKWEELKINTSPEAPMKMSGCGLISHGANKLILFGGFGVPTSGQKVKGVRFKANKDSVSGGASVAGDSVGSESSEGGEEDTARILKDTDESEVNGIEEGSDEEEEKTMTNELKVFDIISKTWSNPSVSGDCPPPCVDFSFTRVDEHRALVFGGFQPETGATADAYLLDIQTWHWHRLGSETESIASSSPPQLWPKGRDGHASCVLSGGPHPQVLVTGGWDKHNKLLYDAWVLDITTGTWAELPGIASSGSVGPRLWHTATSFHYSENLRQLLFFGGCPSAPVEMDEDTSWDKLAGTILVEVGQIEPLSTVELGFNGLYKDSPGYNGREWVVLDSVSHTQMGQPLRRMKEMVLFAEYRAIRAETLARDSIRKIETMSLHHSRSVTPSIDHEVFADLEQTDAPFWVIQRQDIEITSTELGRGKWGVVRVAHFRGEKVAAKCLITPIFSEENRKAFIECMDTAAKMHHHPNLLPFYGAVLDGEPVIVTELMHCNLRVLADKQQLNYNQVLEVALDVAKGLHFLHSTKPEPIVHGDLSCTSILVERGKGNKWKAKLSDFMTARFFKQLLATEYSLSEHSFSSRKDILGSLNTSRKDLRSPSNRSSGSPSPGNSLKRNSSSFTLQKGRKESVTAPDVLDTSIHTTEKDVYCYGLVLVETSTGSPPLEISLIFLIKSIRWPEMRELVDDCLSHDPRIRPAMAEIIQRLSTLLHAISIRSIH